MRLQKQFLRIISALIVGIVSCSPSIEKKDNSRESNMEIPYALTLYDSDFSMSLTIVYVLNGDSLQVKRISGIESESETVLLTRELTDDERYKFAMFLRMFPLDQLQENYENPNVDDGDQKLFVFKRGEIEKQVNCSNFYQNDLALLINELNDLLPNELKITYERIR